jgi:ArsR family transcriptional regulator, arsenate/arsenite/antimonite-responsive transcriptional repressor
MADSLKASRATGAAKPARMNRAQRALILKALADPRRFELLQQIAKAGCPLGCSQALAALPISAATLSHHIKELEAAGLIEVHPRGQVPLSFAASGSSELPGRRFDCARTRFLPWPLTGLKRFPQTVVNPSSWPPPSIRQLSKCRIDDIPIRSRDDEQNLQGKVALVTGASKGIGAAIARELRPAARQSQSTTRAARQPQKRSSPKSKLIRRKSDRVPGRSFRTLTPSGPLVATVAKASSARSAFW